MASSILDRLPSVVKNIVELKEDVKVLSDDAKLVDKKFLILITKELIAEQENLLRRYGKVLYWTEALINIDLQSLDKADYIIMNLNNKPCLKAFQTLNVSDFNVCGYINFYEVHNNSFDDLQINTFKKFPGPEAYKKDFDFALLNKPQLKPANKVVSCLSFFLNFWQTISRKQ